MFTPLSRYISRSWYISIYSWSTSIDRSCCNCYNIYSGCAIHLDSIFNLFNVYTDVTQCTVVTKIKRNDCRLLHSGISISKKEWRRKLINSMYILISLNVYIVTQWIYCHSMYLMSLNVYWCHSMYMLSLNVSTVTQCIYCHSMYILSLNV